MVSKGARRRRKQKRKHLIQDIEHALQKNASTVALSSVQDADLFSIDTTGGTTKAKTVACLPSRGHPVIRKLTKAKQHGVKKIKRKSKSARASSKAEKFFDIWEAQTKPLVERDADLPTPWKGNRVPSLGNGPRPLLPAVVVDAPGCSFNPDPLQHQEMLEKKAVQEELHKPKPSVLTESDVYAQDALVEEMHQFAVDHKEETDSENEEPKVIYRPKIPERKTKAQRNKEERHRQLLKSINHQKAIQKLHAQINNIQHIDREITRMLQARHQKARTRKEAQSKEMRRGLKRMGKKIIYNAPLDVLSPEEARSSSLRLLKPSTDFALNRYVSLQKRGLIDVGRFRGRRNAPRYKYFMPGSRERRVEEAKEEIPVLQARVQALHDQLRHIKLTEETS